MNRELYLYEVVDIIGQGQYDYMEHLWQDPVLRMPEMFGLQGAFYILGAGGGRWPQVINIWDIGSEGWKGLAKNRDTTRGLCDEGSADDRITAWEQRSAGYVTGGDTHLMTPLPRTVYGPGDWEDASLEHWLESQEAHSRTDGR